MTSKAIIEELDKYEFHDMHVESISLYNDNGVQLVLTALPFNANTNDYEKLRLTFSQVVDLRMDEMSLDADSDFEISHFDYKYNECFNCKLLLLLGAGRPSLTIEVKCQHILLDDMRQREPKKFPG
jgi:hypothetical protein